MARYVLRRLGLTVITLFILSVVVFAISAVLPGSVGRAIQFVPFTAVLFRHEARAYVRNARLQPDQPTRAKSMTMAPGSRWR